MLISVEIRNRKHNLTLNQVNQSLKQISKLVWIYSVESPVYTNYSMLLPHNSHVFLGLSLFLPLQIEMKGREHEIIAKMLHKDFTQNVHMFTIQHTPNWVTMIENYI